MKSRLWIVTIAIAAFIACEHAARAQGGGPSPYGAAPPGYAPQGYPPPGYAPQGFAPPGYAQPAAMMQPPPDVLPTEGFPDAGGGFGGETFDLNAVVDPQYPWRYWSSAELLLAWRKGQSTPVLFTTSPSPGTPLQNNGVPTALVLGQPTTNVLFGGAPLGEGADVGANFVVGMWLDELKEVGIATRGFAFAQRGGQFYAASDPSAGGPNLGRPFFNSLSGQQDALPIAFSGIADPVLDPVFINLNRGSVFSQFSNRVYGGELFGRVNWDRAPGYSVDLIGGYVYTRINESLAAGHQFIDLDPGNVIPDGSVFTANESIRAKNDFHGISMGATTELQSGRFTLRALGKVAFGDMHQNVAINSISQATYNLAGNPVVALPGVLGSNGIFVRDQFCVMPEANITGGFQITDNINLSLGYNFMYWTRMASPGNLTTGSLAGNFGAPAPFVWRNSDFWVQGMTFGVNGRF